MQENNNENEKTLKIQKQMIPKKQMLLLSVKKTFPKAN